MTNINPSKFFFQPDSSVRSKAIDEGLIYNNLQ